MLKTNLNRPPVYKSVKPSTKITSVQSNDGSNVTQKIRYPILAEKSIKLYKHNKGYKKDVQKYDISILALSDTEFKNKIFGSFGQTLRKRLESYAAKIQCERANVEFVGGETECYLCDSEIDDYDNKDCEHILPMKFAVIFMGMETVGDVYNLIYKAGANQKNFKELTKQNYKWAHDTCNRVKSDINPVAIYNSKGHYLKIKASEENISLIIEKISNKRYIDKDKRPIIKSNFKIYVEQLCIYINDELQAIYKLFEDSGIPPEEFTPLIINYYVSIVKIYARNDVIWKLKQLEKQTPVQEEKIEIKQKIEEIQLDLRKLEDEILEQFQQMKMMFSRLKKENGRLRIFKFHEDDTNPSYAGLFDISNTKISTKNNLWPTNPNQEYLWPRIKINMGPLFYKRNEIPSYKDMPRWIRNLTEKINLKIVFPLFKMQKDGIVLDEELINHFISFVQFDYAFMEKNVFKKTFSHYDDLIPKMYYENKEVLLDSTSENYDKNSDIVSYKVIYCQLLFTLLEKMGWVANYNYKESLILEKLKNYLRLDEYERDYYFLSNRFNHEIDFSTNICDNIFNEIIKKRIADLTNLSPRQLLEEKMEIDLNKPDYDKQYTRYKRDDQDIIMDESSGGKKVKRKLKTRKIRKNRKIHKKLIQ